MPVQNKPECETPLTVLSRRAQISPLCFLCVAAIQLLTMPSLALAANAGDDCTAAKADTWEVSTSDPSTQIHCDGSKWRVLGKLDDSGAPTSRIKQTITFGDSSSVCGSAMEGSIRFNSGSATWDFCNGTIWTSFENVGGDLCVTPVLCPNIGDTCNDGNANNNPDPKFAGFMAYNGSNTCEPLFTTQANQSSSTWKTSTGSNDIATDSHEDGKINDNQIANSNTFPAFKVCKDLTYGGYTDWYLPAMQELNLLYKNQTAIGSFTANYYVSSSEYTTIKYWNLGFDYGGNDNQDKNLAAYVRCVRRNPVCSRSGLVGHWKFNETSGTTATDSASGYNGTLTNMDPATDWVTGKISGALDFDGSNDYVRVSQIAPLNVSVFTFAAWVYQTDNSGVRGVFGGQSNGMPNLVLYNADLRFEKQGISTIATIDTNLALNTWYHVALTYDASGNYVFYLNGLVTGSGNSPQTFTFSDRLIGSRYTGSGYFSGMIDDARIYNRVLSLTEISNLYNVGTGCQ